MPALRIADEARAHRAGQSRGGELGEGGLGVTGARSPSGEIVGEVGGGSLARCQLRTAHTNRLAAATSPYLLQHSTIRSIGGAWGRRRSTRQAPRKADLALGRICGLPLVPCDGARELRGRGDRARDERAVRQHQGRPRGAARHRPDLHERAASAGRAGRLAADDVPDAAGEPLWGGTYFPKEARFGRAAFTDVLRELARLFR